MLKCPPDDKIWGGRFSESIYASDGWPSVQYTGYTLKEHLEQATRTHKGLFAIIYRYPISLKAISWTIRADSAEDELRSDINAVITLCAYAEYYGCLNKIAPAILDILLSHKAVWKCTAWHPLDLTMLAKKLRNKEIYFDALRHLIVRCSAHNYMWRSPGEVLNISRGEVEERMQPLFREQEKTVAKLRDDLERLSLMQHNIGHRDGCAYTTFINAISFKRKNRPAVEKARERVDLIARSMYGQWLIQKLVGNQLGTTLHGRLRVKSVAPFNQACKMLCEASQSLNPAEIFGCNAGSRMSFIFRLRRRLNPEDALNDSLKKLVHQAANIINNTFQTRDRKLEDKTVVTSRRCRHQYYNERFTYLPLNESETPWDGEEPRNEVKAIPQVSTKEVSDKTLSLLGIAKQETEVVGNEASNNSS